MYVIQNTSEGEQAKKIITDNRLKYNKHYGKVYVKRYHQGADTNNPKNIHRINFVTNNLLVCNFRLECIVLLKSFNIKKASVITTSSQDAAIQQAESKARTGTSEQKMQDQISEINTILNNVDIIQSSDEVYLDYKKTQNYYHKIDTNTHKLIYKTDTEYEKSKKRNTRIGVDMPFEQLEINSISANIGLYLILNKYFTYTKTANVFNTNQWTFGTSRSKYQNYCDSFELWYYGYKNSEDFSTIGTIGSNILDKMFYLKMPSVVPFLIVSYRLQYTKTINNYDLIWILALYYATAHGSFGSPIITHLQTSLIKSLKVCLGENNFHPHILMGKKYAEFYNEFVDYNLSEQDKTSFIKMSDAAKTYISTELYKYVDYSNPKTAELYIKNKIVSEVKPHSIVKDISLNYCDGTIQNHFTYNDLMNLFGDKFAIKTQSVYAADIIQLTLICKLPVSTTFTELKNDLEYPTTVGQMFINVNYSNVELIKHYTIDTINTTITYDGYKYALLPDDMITNALLKEMFYKQVRYYTVPLKKEFNIEINNGTITTQLSYIFTGLGGCFLRNFVIGIQNVDHTESFGLLNMFKISALVGSETISESILTDVVKDPYSSYTNSLWFRPKNDMFGGPYSFDSKSIEIKLNPTPNSSKIVNISAKYKLILIGIVEVLIESTGDGVEVPMAFHLKSLI